MYINRKRSIELVKAFDEQAVLVSSKNDKKMQFFENGNKLYSVSCYGPFINSLTLPSDEKYIKQIHFNPLLINTKVVPYLNSDYNYNTELNDDGLFSVNGYIMDDRKIYFSSCFNLLGKKDIFDELLIKDYSNLSFTVSCSYPIEYEKIKDLMNRVAEQLELIKCKKLSFENYPKLINLYENLRNEYYNLINNVLLENDVISKNEQVKNTSYQLSKTK